MRLDDIFRKRIKEIQLNTKQYFYVMLFSVFAVFPLVVSSPYWHRVLCIGFYYAILASSWDLIMGYTGQFSWGQQMFSALGAYTSSIVAVRFGFPLLISIPLGLGAGALVGLVIGLIVFRMRGFYLCLTTWVLGEALSVVLCVEEPLTGGTKGMYAPRFFDGHWLSYYYIGLGLVIFTVFILEKIVNLRIGLYLRAIRDDEDAAEALGVDTFKWKTFAFVISGLFGSLAGVYFAHFEGLIAPSMASSLVMAYLVTMVVFGGMGTLIGAIIGAPLVTIILEYVRGAALQFSLMAFAVVIMLMMRGMRGGIVELSQKIQKRYLKEWWSARARSADSDKHEG